MHYQTGRERARCFSTAFLLFQIINLTGNIYFEATNALTSPIYACLWVTFSREATGSAIALGFTCNKFSIRNLELPGHAGLAQQVSIQEFSGDDPPRTERKKNRLLLA